MLKNYKNKSLKFVSVFMAVVLLVGCTKESDSAQSLPQVPIEAPSSSTVSSVPVISEPESIIEETPVPIEFSFTEEEITRLNTLLDEWAAVKEEEEENGNTVAVFFRDIESGLTYAYNTEATFPVASLNKAPYAMYIYHLVEIGQASLDETFHVTEAMVEDMKENSGKLREMEDLPKDFTLAEMLDLMVCYSDTAALRFILARYGAGGYITYLQELGVPTDNVKNVTNGVVTTADADAYLSSLYNFFSTSQYGETLKTQLSKTNYHMIRTKNQYVGKYGWDENAYHDMGIIYAEHPYQLVILTDKDVGSWAEFGMFTTIAKMFEEMMNQKWATVST